MFRDMKASKAFEDICGSLLEDKKKRRKFLANIKKLVNEKADKDYSVGGSYLSVKEVKSCLPK